MIEHMYLFMACLGACAGFLYVFFAWRDKPSSKADFKNDLRLKGLFWGAWGAFIVLIADWRRVASTVFDEPNIRISRFALFGAYIGGFLLGFIVVLFLVSLSILWDCFRVNRFHGNVLESENCTPVKVFLFHGYLEYKDTVKRAIELHRSRQAGEEKDAKTLELIAAIESATEVIENQRDELSQRRRLTRETSDILISAIDIYRGFVLNKTEAKEASRRLLKPIAQLAAYYAGVESRYVNANYMVVQSAEVLTEEEIMTARFTFGEKKRYVEFLALRDYARPGTNFIRLPVEPTHIHDWAERALPGAPEAFARRQPTICNIKAIKFGKQVPKVIRDEQIKYFSELPFDTVISLPLLAPLDYNSDGWPIGVLNIDLSLGAEGFDDDPAHEDARELEALISPLSALIADIARTEIPFSRSKL